MEGSLHSLRLKAQAKKGAKGGKEQHSLTTGWKGKLQTKRKQRSSPVIPPTEKKMKSSVSFLVFKFWGKYDSCVTFCVYVVEC